MTFTEEERKEKQKEIATRLRKLTGRDTFPYLGLMPVRCNNARGWTFMNDEGLMMRDECIDDCLKMTYTITELPKSK